MHLTLSTKGQPDHKHIDIDLIIIKWKTERQVGKLKTLCVHFLIVLTITVQVIGLIGPASGLYWVARGSVATGSLVVCQEVSQGEGLPLLILLLS